MGRSFTEPEVSPRKDVAGNVVSYVITRVVDPDDEFAEEQVLCEDWTGEDWTDCDFLWKSVGASYDGTAVEERPGRIHTLWRIIRAMQFGRDSVSVSHSL